MGKTKTEIMGILGSSESLFQQGLADGDIDEEVDDVSGKKVYYMVQVKKVAVRQANVLLLLSCLYIFNTCSLRLYDRGVAVPRRRPRRGRSLLTSRTQQDLTNTMCSASTSQATQVSLAR